MLFLGVSAQAQIIEYNVTTCPNSTKLVSGYFESNRKTKSREKHSYLEAQKEVKIVMHVANS